MLRDFIEFIREKGVVGLAVGFLMGGAISKLVTALVEDIINPLVGLMLGKAGNLAEASVMVGTATLKWGAFITTLIDFIIICAVIYLGVRVLRLDRIDKKKT
ncbi:MAG: MscL family protein [Patescibacteria group bacterium]|nr:MAG: MscL family protein [Patescibacteria group bacterium]